MKLCFLVFFLFGSIIADAQTQTLLGSGVEFSTVKKTFAKSERLYSYIKHKSYIKPSILIKDPLAAFSNGLGVGVGLFLTNSWNMGVGYHTLPYTRYRMSQVMFETGIDLLPYFSGNTSAGVFANFAFGPAFVKGMQGIKLSTRPSFSFKYRLTKNISSVVEGEINIVHHTSTKFLTYLAASVGVSYVIDIKARKQKRVPPHPIINADITRLLPNNRDMSKELLVFVTERLNNHIVQSCAQSQSLYSFTPEEKQYVHVGTHKTITKSSPGIIDMRRTFRNPLPGGRVISPYKGRRPNHHGIDLKLTHQDTIRAAFDGQVRLSRRYSTYGNVIVIRHANGLETLYSHNEKHFVRVNDLVKSGDPIAISGRTGRATTEHLHFEIRIRGQHVDPNLFYNFREDRFLSDSLRIEAVTAGHYAIKYLRPKKSEGSLMYINMVNSKREKKNSYVVKQGDTLSLIADKYRTRIYEICELNQLSENAILQIGLRITLP